jgi:hypothetical protein
VHWLNKIFGDEVSFITGGGIGSLVPVEDVAELDCDVDWPGFLTWLAVQPVRAAARTTAIDHTSLDIG